MNDFVDFIGDEKEKEFLEKCLVQWEKTSSSNYSDTMKMCHIGTVFSEIRHRLEEMGDEI